MRSHTSSKAFHMRIWKLAILGIVLGYALMGCFLTVDWRLWPISCVSAVLIWGSAIIGGLDFIVYVARHI